MTAAALSGNRVEIVAYYAARYGGLAPVDTDAGYLRDLERDCNQTWYELGLYDKCNHDYYGVTYTLADSVADDYAFEADAVDYFIDNGRERVNG